MCIGSKYVCRLCETCKYCNGKCTLVVYVISFYWYKFVLLFAVAWNMNADRVLNIIYTYM